MHTESLSASAAILAASYPLDINAHRQVLRQNTTQDSSGLGFDPFQGLPPPPPHDPARHRDAMSIIRDFKPDMSSIKTPGSSFDLDEELEKRGLADAFKHIRKEESPPKHVAFGDDFGAQNDWGDMGFGDEEFGRGAEVILETEAPEEGHVDYPEDFPPPTDVFGPGFDWSTANMTEPSWPHSFPGEPLGGSEIADKSRYPIDTSLDADAVSYPLNAEKINEIRRKLSKICNDQYREIIEMLRQDFSSDQDQLGHLLKRVTSDPFEDPNATLAPIEREQARPQSRGRTPEHKSPKSDKGFSPLNERIDNITSLSILAKSHDRHH